MASTPDLPTVLRAEGHRVTGPRLAVWRALVEGGGHHTADELTVTATSRDPSINRASVYRSLQLFEELGLVRQTALGEAASRWELDHPDEHFHLVCRRCGDVDHHVGTLVQQVRNHLADGHGFLAQDVDLTVTGLCERCASDTDDED